MFSRVVWWQKVVSAYGSGYVFLCLFFFQVLFFKWYLHALSIWDKGKTGGWGVVVLL